jgi:hypothetical protein
MEGSLQTFDGKLAFSAIISNSTSQGKKNRIKLKSLEGKIK